MSETKHTPGPWIWDDEECGNSISIRHDPQNPRALGDEVASVYRDGIETTDDMRADARLIAAAPDLLSIARRWAALDGGSWHVERHANDKKELLADTNAAIAKAEMR